MKRSPKQNGTEAETMTANYLRSWFPEVRRLALAGTADVGDLGGIPGLTVQVKGQHRMELAAWVDQAAKQHQRAGTDHFVVVHRRWNKSPARWYATTELGAFASMYASVVGLEAPT
jgi:hypothetical protein